MGLPVVAIACLFLLWVSPATALRQLGPGDPAPPVILHDGTGATRPLAELLGPKGALVVFWASWNPRSAEILAYLKDLSPSYESEGLTVLPVNADREGMDPNELRRMAELYRTWELPWPSHFDPDYDAYGGFGVITQPTSVYVSSEGAIVGSYPGFPAEAREALPALIREGLGVRVRAREAPLAVEVRYEPRNGAGPLFQMGRVLYHRGQKRKALQRVEEALGRDPEYALARAAAAYAAHRSGRVAQGEEHLAILRDRVRSHPASREALGIALLALGRTEESRAVLEPLVNEEEPHPRGLLALASLRAGDGDLLGALELVDRLEAWPMGGATLRLDTEILLGSSPPEEAWSDREAFALRLLDFDA